MANDDLGASDLVHYCWTGPGLAPCCKSLEEAREKYTVAAVNLMHGSSLQTPCESRWTNLLPAMVRTLVKRFVKHLGHSGMPSSSEKLSAEAMQMESDSAAYQEYLTILNGVRCKTVGDYLSNEMNFFELAVYTVLLTISDKMPFGMLGGVDRQGGTLQRGCLS